MTAGTVRARDVATSSRDLTQNATQAVEAMYEEIAEQLLRESAAPAAAPEVDAEGGQ